MRLIDADALPMYDELFMNGINKSGVWVRYRDVEKLIRNAPTIEERKKGKWEYVEDVDYRCSVCHKYAYGCLGEVLSGQYKYCPYCGAEMKILGESE